jgi:hypothetical protein
MVEPIEDVTCFDLENIVFSAELENAPHHREHLLSLLSLDDQEILEISETILRAK